MLPSSTLKIEVFLFEKRISPIIHRLCLLKSSMEFSPRMESISLADLVARWRAISGGQSADWFWAQVNLDRSSRGADPFLPFEDRNGTSNG